MKHNWQFVKDPYFRILSDNVLIFNNKECNLFKICLNCNQYVYKANNSKWYMCNTVSGVNPITCEKFIIKNIIE